ncbi:gremlin-2-like, partial [Pollicipes pollicipes]|uniref:gremlin-2-like n=1 Tax=Pollicipes pollicipes TaxID=41117 RepID=UPI0018859A18
TSSRRARLITKRRYLKQDWCKTEQLVRRLREPGCRSRRVLDNFCYGQCNSFYIPREGRRRGLEPFQSCAFCQPRSWRTVAVTFRCPGQVPARRRRRVRLVKRCRCSTEKLQR